MLLFAVAGMSKLAPGEEQSMEEVVRSAVPLGCMGEKQDIALACVFLASSAARWAVGEGPDCLQVTRPAFH